MENVDKELAQKIAKVIDEAMQSLGARPMTQSDLSRITKVPQPTISRTLSAQTVPELKTLARLALALDLDVDSLAKGKYKRARSATNSHREGLEPPHAHPGQLLDLEEHPDLISVRRVKFKLQAGVQGYAIELDNGSGPPIFFRKDWLTQRGFRADKLIGIRVTGQSMEPNLYDGDLVVVNTAEVEPKDGEPFAVSYEGEPGIKRLRRDSGEWWLTSDNADQRRYAPKRCSADVKIIGRVVYKQSERI